MGLTFGELKQLANALPSYGMSELMAQAGFFAWPEQCGDLVAQQSRSHNVPSGMRCGMDGGKTWTLQTILFAIRAEC